MGRKSHYGCDNCKKRHVKCDELQPRCMRCEKRGDKCHYDHLTRSGNNASMEVRLMYQWTTATCHSMGRDVELYQKKLPQLAFENQFLMDALFMICAAHLYHTTVDEEYSSFRSLYHGRATSGLRAELAKGISKKNCEAVAFSSTIFSVYVMTLDHLLDKHEFLDQWLSMVFAMGQIFDDIVPFVRETCFEGILSAFDVGLPSGKVYLPQIEKIYEKQKTNLTFYHPAIVYLAIITEVVVTRPSDVDLRVVFHWLFKMRNLKSLIVERDPCALVLLARFLYLLSLIRGVWFLESNSLQRHNDIKSLIPPDWQEYVPLV